VDQGKERVLKNRRITIHEDAEMLAILFGSVLIILKDSLKVCCIAAKFMPQLLSEGQKESNCFGPSHHKHLC
jgi:hypothetical protein